MKFLKYIYKALIVAAGTVSIFYCTKLDQKVYSVVPNQNFWQTPEQIAAGIAPAYASLTNIPDGDYHDLGEISGDGDLDFVVNNENMQAFVYLNMFRENLHTNYLKMKLQGLMHNIALLIPNLQKQDYL